MKNRAPTGPRITHLPEFSIVAMKRHMREVAANRRAHGDRDAGLLMREIENQGQSHGRASRMVRDHERHEVAVREQRCLICRVIWVRVTAERIMAGAA